MAKKKVKRKINVKAFCILLLVIYLIAMIIYYFLSMPIKNIYINGNEYVTDHEIISISKLKKYPTILKVSSSKIEKNINKIDLIKEVKVKRNIFGRVTINVVENKVLFFNRNNNKYVLSNKQELDNINVDHSVTTLINYVPDDIYQKLIEGLDKINSDILSSVSEIEYSVSKSGEKIIDDSRFILTMNDGNTVYINLLNIKNLNNYQSIYATLNDTLGIIYLDSSSNENVYFKSYESLIDEGDKVNE